MAMARPAPEAAGAAKSAPAEDAAADTSSEAAAGGSSTVAVRKFFPETWLWTDLALLPGTGANAGTAVASVPVIAPDTITTWSLEAFATSSEGISAVRAELPLRVFKPFFVEVKLPYAPVRGEDLELVFAVFNYIAGSGSLNATLDIELPPGIEVVDGSVSAVQLLVDESSATHSSLRIRPKSLGPWSIRATARATSSGAQLTDAVERPLLVRAEGFAVSRTENMVLDLSESRAANASVTLVLPESAVNGSARLTVAAVGDLLGPTVSGLDRLLRIPTGCGEQNMIGLAPNVYVAKYLLAMGQLRPEIRQRVVNNIIVGYGRQLTYRHGDGSFSAFGSSDSSGSTWLTAFVLRVFAEVQGSGLVSVDSSVLAAAATWLVQLQNSDGSFKSMGNVIHIEMLGGAGSSIALTAFVASALAKAATEVPALAVSGLPQALQKAGAFLSGSQSLDTYSGLLRAQAMALSGLWTSLQVADAALALSSATTGRRFWTSSGDVETTTSSPAGYGRLGAKTLDVEMTGYGVLALTLAGKLSQAFEGAKWLMKKRSALGGFSSAQDTVVALNALATYATAVGRNVDLSLEIKEIKDGRSFQETLAIDASNVDVLQSMALNPTPGDNSLEVKATGKGTALVIAEFSYNLPKSAAEPCYDIAVEWFGSDDAYSVAVQGCSTPRQDCQSRVVGSMSIISIGLFTGYAASSSSLSELKAATGVKRYEISDGRVDLYLEEIKNSGSTCVQFNVTREFKVWNTQAAVSEIYEYYAPEARGENLASFSFKAMASDVADLPEVSPSTTKTPGVTSTATTSIVTAGMTTYAAATTATETSSQVTSTVTTSIATVGTTSETQQNTSSQVMRGSFILSGKLNMVVPNASAFVNDPAAKQGIAKSFANISGVDVSQVSVTLPLGTRRLSVRQLQSQSVLVDYTIKVNSASEAAATSYGDEIKGKIQAVSSR
ncbi:unnamed protein product [Polarella glacialis]|nr:unnamed protein product [Polarella glacialis]